MTRGRFVYFSGVVGLFVFRQYQLLDEYEDFHAGKAVDSSYASNLAAL